MEHEGEGGGIRIHLRNKDDKHDVFTKWRPLYESRFWNYSDDPII